MAYFACHLIIEELVQGFCYRVSMAGQARLLGVPAGCSTAATVRSKRVASGEWRVASGEEEAITALLNWAHRGSPRARVMRVHIRPEDGEFDSFQQESTV
jgi:acylphosphatase